MTYEVANGSYECADPRGLAMVFAAVLDGMALHVAVDDEFDAQRMCAALVALLTRG